MDFTSRLAALGFAQIIFKAILLSLLGIFLLVAFIAFRRWYRGRYFQQLNERTFALRSQWNEILSGKVPARSWRLKTLDCEIVESILLDSIEAASPQQLPPLLHCLRSSGLLDMRIHEARGVGRSGPHTQDGSHRSARRGALFAGRRNPHRRHPRPWTHRVAASGRPNSRLCASRQAADSRARTQERAGQLLPEQSRHLATLFEGGNRTPA